MQIEQRKNQFAKLKQQEQREKILLILDKLSEQSNIFAKLYQTIIIHRQIPEEIYSSVYADILNFANILEKDEKEDQFKKNKETQIYIEKLRQQEILEKENLTLDVN